MGLQITNIKLRNYRNYEAYSLSSIGSLVLLIGPNAVGKTNLIEALQFTSAGFSFRNPKAEHIRYPGSAITDIESVIAGDGRSLSIRMIVDDEGKQFFLNGKKRPLREIKGILPAVVFSPDDLDLVKGGQREKRAALDSLGGQLSQNYDTVRRDYEKALRQKNSYLKEEAPTIEVLDSLSSVVATIGAQLYSLRLSLLKELQPYIQEAFSQIVGQKEQLELRYLPSWDSRKNETHDTIFEVEEISRQQAKEVLEQAYETNKEAELERKRTLYGPHLDRVEFYIDGRNAAVFASQGQQRSIVLAYKIAEVELIKARLNQYPVLFLDDVMSELDETRRQQLEQLVSQDIQTFITSTNLGYFSEGILRRAQVLRLGGENG